MNNKYEEDTLLSRCAAESVVSIVLYLLSVIHLNWHSCVSIH